MANEGGAAVQQVVEALKVLYSDPNPSAKEKADGWLKEFQKSNDAWATAQLILFAPDAPVETKLFAAQTFRTKITYDLDTLPPAHLLPLRDSLLTALRQFASGPRVILTQICIALADLALQLTADQWDDPTASMIELFGKDPAMAGALLEWLQVLAEEYNSNFKLEVRNDFGRGGGKSTERGAQVIGLLSMYVSAEGITPALHNQCFACLGAWLRTGQASASSIAGSTILNSAFASLPNDELFETAVDALVDIIHETQELQDNVAVIQEIVPQLTALKATLSDPATREDEDRMRGLCRILVEAGEWYEPLIVQHQESFLPLVQAIAECAAYDELEIVGITLNFWYKLSKGLRKARESTPPSPAMLDVFANLVGTIIRHLHYPDDDASLVGHERDTFRNFRHTIGDTLKDCCGVLGATTCLRRSFDIISAALSTGAAVKWQDVEAPLFSMRSMGAEVDPRDNEIMPQIMDVLPKLPPHPKIRYAAILVIGRYTQWIDYHPEHIQFQLPYISSGFEQDAQSGEADVSAAAAQAMKYLCKDCSHHLVPYLPQLHTFLQSVATKIGPEDLLDLAAAMAHIIVVMPPNEQPQALSTFVMPNVELVHSLATRDSPATQEELRAACDALERIDMYLAIVGQLPDGLPPSCAETCGQVWSVFDAWLAKYGSNPLVAEKTCIALRRGLQFFDEAAFQVAPAILERLAVEFEKAPASSYLWITGKMVDMFARREDRTFDAAVKAAFERESGQVFQLLQRTAPAQVADLLDDYVHLVNDLIEYSPATIFLSPSFPSSFQSLLSTLTLLSPQIVLAALDTLRSIIGHEALQFDPSQPNLPAHFGAYPTYATAIRSVVEASSGQLVALLLEGLVEGGEDASTNILTVFRLLSIQFPTQLAQSIAPALERLPPKVVNDAEKVEFGGKFGAAVSEQNPNKVKDAFTWLLRTSRKSRERARISEDRR